MQICDQLFFVTCFPFDILEGASTPGVDPLLHCSSKPTMGFAYEWKHGNLDNDYPALSSTMSKIYGLSQFTHSKFDLPAQLYNFIIYRYLLIKYAACKMSYLLSSAYLRKEKRMKLSSRF